MRYFDHLVVAYFMGHPVYWLCESWAVSD